MSTKNENFLREEFWLVRNIEKFKKELSENNISGLALDIDETLSFTLQHWFSVMREKFGNPENLEVIDIIKKYRYAQYVPYWQTPEAKEWMNEARLSNKLQVELPLIENANSLVQKVNEIKPIVIYLTTRPEAVTEGTIKWLRKHNFPKAPIVARPENVTHEDGLSWKAKILESLYPEIEGIVDDHPGLLEKLPDSYKGTIYLYDNIESKRKDIKVIPCPTWEDVLTEVQKSKPNR